MILGIGSEFGLQERIGVKTKLVLPPIPLAFLN